MAKIGKKANPFSWGFDTLSMAPFDNVASVGAAAALTTVQARLSIPQRCKIAKVTSNVSAVTGAVTLQITKGTGASGAVGTADTVAAAGASLFGTAPTVASVADTPDVVVPDVPDVIYNTGDLMTLRVTTIATTGAITNLKVSLLLAVLDPFPQLQVKAPAAGAGTPTQTVGW